MEKILSKELLLQNLNSTDMFLVKNSMLRIFEELLKGKQGLLSMQDIIFSQKSELKAEEFLKNFGTYFTEIPQRNAQKWDTFFNILEQRRCYISICRLVVLNMYLSDKLSKEEKHKCCFWLNNHCQLGYHQALILKMLSYPDDGKLLLLAKKYCRQEIELSQKELDQICLLPIRTSRKLEIFSLFIRDNKREYNFSIIKKLLDDLKKTSTNATQDEKNKMWNMLLSLLQKNPFAAEIETFQEMYKQGLITTEIYLNLLSAYVHNINIYPFLLDSLIEGYTQIVKSDKKRIRIKNITEELFFLLEQKKSQITEKVLDLMLKIISIWQNEMWFKIEYLPNYRAKMYQNAILVRNVNLPMLKRCLKIDECLFLMLVSQIEEKDIKSLLAEVAYNNTSLWHECLENILSMQEVDILSIIKNIADLYKEATKEAYKQIFSNSLKILLNNLPEKENIASNAKQILSFMYSNANLKNLVDSYLEKANISMTNYLIG